MSCYMHRFDPQTRRCKCGRWQAGHAPKKVLVKPRAECQICEREQALNGEHLGHHGYKRPGWGSIVGDCMGAGHKPYPATDALVLYQAVVAGFLIRAKITLQDLPNEDALDYTTQQRTGYGTSEITHHRIERGAKPDYKIGLPSYEDALRYQLRDLAREIAAAEHDQKRVTARIAAAAGRAA